MDYIHKFIGGVTGSEEIGFFDLDQPSLYVAAAAIAFNPLFWNIAAQLEYRNHVLTRLFGGPYVGCYALAVTIFTLGIFRDNLYLTSLQSQPIYPPLHYPVLGALLFLAGNTLVLSSMFALGVTGTYLGDYFGILMDEPVTGFPFNITDAPMYWGSTMSFLGTALYYGRTAGVALTVQVFFCYLIALQFEDPFTAQIYAKRERKRAQEQTVDATKTS